MNSSLVPEPVASEKIDRGAYPWNEWSFGPRSQGIARALKLRQEIREQISQVSPSAPDVFESASPGLDAWVDKNFDRTNAEVLVGWKGPGPDNRSDFAAALWTDRRAADADFELGLSDAALARVNKTADGRFACLDLVVAGRVWGQGYGASLADRAVSAARMMGLPSVVVRAPTPQLAAWFERRGFEVAAPSVDGAPAVLCRNFGSTPGCAERPLAFRGVNMAVAFPGPSSGNLGPGDKPVSVLVRELSQAVSRRLTEAVRCRCAFGRLAAIEDSDDDEEFRTEQIRRRILAALPQDQVPAFVREAGSARAIPDLPVPERIPNLAS